jgi:hypothetical protein
MKNLMLILTFLSTTFLIGCVGNPISDVVDLAASRKIQICTKGSSTSCDSKYIITLDQVTLVSHDNNGTALNPPHTVLTPNGVVFSAVVNGVTKYFGAATDWATEWANIKNLPAAQQDHALTLFFQNQFDTLGFLKQSVDTVADGQGGSTNIFKYEFVNNPGIYFSESSESVKDVEAMGANIEASKLDNLAETLAASYGLSEERANSVAKNISAYQKLSTRRSLTEKEKNFFSSELLGVSFKNAQNALTSGNTQDLNDLLEKAADKNGTSPEQISLILNEVFL